jgi:hypothetical protein
MNMKKKNSLNLSENIDQTPDLSKADVWVDKQEILMRLHISNRTLQTWRSKGILPYTRIGAKIYYRESDITDLLKMNSQGVKQMTLSRSRYGNST